MRRAQRPPPHTTETTWVASRSNPSLNLIWFHRHWFIRHCPPTRRHYSPVYLLTATPTVTPTTVHFPLISECIPLDWHAPLSVLSHVILVPPIWRTTTKFWTTHWNGNAVNSKRFKGALKLPESDHVLSAAHLPFVPKTTSWTKWLRKHKKLTKTKKNE